MVDVHDKLPGSAYVFAAQLVHAELPDAVVGANFPYSHGVQPVLPWDAEYDPPGQTKQVDEPGDGWYFPAGQTVQLHAPPVENVPTGHSPHEVDPSDGACVPGGHDVQLPCCGIAV